MRQQTGRVAQRCYGSLVTIGKFRDTLPRKTLEHLIRALVFPHLFYCLPAWAPSTKQERQRIEKVINFAIRTVTRKRKFDHVSVARKQLGWMTFETLIHYRDCALIHSLLHQSQAPERLVAIVSYRADVSERSTRTTEARLLQVPRVRLEKKLV